MSDQFVSVITDEAMQRACYGTGWRFTPFQFAVSTTDLLAGFSEDQIFNRDGSVSTAAWDILKQYTTAQVQEDDNNGNIWCQLPFSSLSKATETSITHHIVIPANLDIDGETKQIKTIYFLYKDNNEQVFLYAIARANSYMIYETGVTQSFFFNFTITNSPSQDISNFVINYSYPQEIEDHNTRTDTHDFLIARDGSRKASGILEYTNSFTFTKPNQLITMQYVQSLVNDFVSVACPPGMMMWWPGTSAPDGWTIRNGQWLELAKNPGVYSVIGRRYGYKVENGKEYFQLMNDSGVFIRGCEVNGNSIVNNSKLSGTAFGQIQDSAAPNIRATFGGVNAGYSGATWQSGGRITLSTRNGSNWGSWASFSADRCSGVYKDGVSEIRPTNRNYLPVIKLG